MIEWDVRTLLAQHTNIVAAVGSRIYRKIPQQARYPLIRFLPVSEEPIQTLDGPQDLESIRLQIDAISEDPREARTIAELVRYALDGYTGSIGESNIRAITRQPGGVSLDVPRGDGSDDIVFAVVRDYVVWFEQSVPTF
jgi:hypothetical protein